MGGKIWGRSLGLLLLGRGGRFWGRVVLGRKINCCRRLLGCFEWNMGGRKYEKFNDKGGCIE